MKNKQKLKFDFKNIIFLIFLITFSLFNGCQSTKYLPDYKTMNEGVYGAEITIYIGDDWKTEKIYRGELIAADSSEFYVLMDNVYQGILKKYSYSQVSWCTIRYAKFTGDGIYFTIPLFLAHSISHGFFALFTFPINLIYSFSLMDRGTKFTYTPKKISQETLSKFARFPQGLPKDFLK